MLNQSLSSDVNSLPRLSAHLRAYHIGTPARSSSSFLLLFLTFYPSQLHTHQVGPRIATRPLQTSNQVSSNTTAALFAPSSRRRNFNTAIAHLQSLGTTAVKMKLSIFAILAVVASVRAGSPCTSGVNNECEFNGCCTDGLVCASDLLVCKVACEDGGDYCRQGTCQCFYKNPGEPCVRQCGCQGPGC
ncbi:unnamed protein product [Zymoseptoria tritici ST99CH_1A5]|uniref:Uncharacterized protein n=1 Tax=Zymoseptoria tritici ST99CH_1A5 TaxID=1276529 RepID=A0A1Y6LZY6_ZYMTR|nr:unnamed protein product [Zymoseptoria tritici ST99CH_1A5]